MADENAGDEPQGPLELFLIGDVSDNESDVTEKLTDIPPGGECIIYFDSPGGSPYSAMSLSSIMRLRDIQATGIVTGECSSAALWPFAACKKRYVTKYSVLLFHAMKWQSEEHVEIREAREWTRHFEFLEGQMDSLLAELFDIPLEKILPWLQAGRYVTGPELAELGLAQLIDLKPLEALQAEEQNG